MCRADPDLSRREAAVLALPVDVPDLVAELRGGLHQQPDHGGLGAVLRHRQGAAHTVVLGLVTHLARKIFVQKKNINSILPPLHVLRLLVVGENVLVAPALEAERVAPLVVVPAVPACGALLHVARDTRHAAHL